MSFESLARDCNPKPGGRSMAEKGNLNAIQRQGSSTVGQTERACDVLAFTLIKSKSQFGSQAQ